MAKAPTKSTAVTKWDEELAKHAAMAAGIEASVQTGSWISTKGGRMSYNGQEVKGNKMNVIILDHILENHYYTARYDPDNPASPVCFAFARSDDDMSPHEKSSDPQSEACHGCPQNEWGTADTGRGKACANIRRLALIPEDGMEDVSAAQVAYMKIPVTSVKGWAGYVNNLSTVMKRPPFGVITEISVVPDDKTQFKIQFKLVEKIEDGEALGAIMERRAAVESELMAPYSPMEVEEKPTPRSGKVAGKVAGKPAGKR